MEELRNQITESKKQGELPSVSEKVLKEHEAIRDEFERRKSSRQHIGFMSD
jgi:hypothetical protein